MPTTPMDALLEHLLAGGRLDDRQSEEVQDEHGRTGRPIRQILLDMGLFTEDEVNEAIAEALASEVVDLGSLSIPEATYQVLTADTARMYNVVPVDADPSRVRIATFEMPGTNMVGTNTETSTSPIEIRAPDTSCMER